MMARLKQVLETPRPATTPPPPRPASQPTADPHTFPTIPGYTIVGVLGGGGMGVVYRARDTRLDRLVALKMLRGDAPGDSELLIRFLAEMESATSLHHPNIVPIYEVGRHADRPYFAMELV